jgi:lantibiotic modifying enzyme
MGWKVFLPESSIKRVESKVNELAHAVAASSVDSNGLMGGAAGLACFYAYYAEWTGDLRFDRLAAETIEQALNPAASSFPGYQFSNGLAGIGWTVDHLIASGLMNFDASNIFNQLDAHLNDTMMEDIREGQYDYLHAALGIALYFLRKPDEEKYRQYLAELVQILCKHAIVETDGSIKWVSLLDSDSDKSGYNLSLSHGMASIVIILSRIMTAGIATPVCDKLIRGCLKYFDKQRLDPNNYISTFPAWAIESMEAPHHSRLAWCYGDLGIGMAYLSAGRLFPNLYFGLDGIDILLKTTKRRDPQENTVLDAGICHGAAGIALIYNVLYQSTSRKAFMESAAYWLDVCLNMACHEDGIAGYKTWFLPQYGGWKSTAGLLEGAAGTGLVLMSFISEKEPAWSQSLLLN